jgi:hypothetical protein
VSLSLSEALPFIGMAVGAAASYWGAHMAIKVEIARIDERVKAMKEKLESDHARLNDLESRFDRKAGA